MTFGRSGESPEEGITALKFWVLFIVGLVVVLSLYRGFVGGDPGGGENEKLKEARLTKKKREQ